MQRRYHNFICEVKQNFQKTTLGNTFIVLDYTKKDKFLSNGALRSHCEQIHRTNFNRSRAKCLDRVKTIIKNRSGYSCHVFFNLSNKQAV